MNAEVTTVDASLQAAARQRLLVVLATLLEALYDDSAVQVLATLKPADMRSGGARIPGTSYELPPHTATSAMQQLVEMRGCLEARPLLAALAEADVAARMAAITGKAPPTVASLYPFCTPPLDQKGSESLRAALLRLFQICEQMFTLTHMRRLDELLYNWGQAPQDLDTMPVQKFVAQFVRNAPP
jgi:hypothetical protein